MTKATLKNEKDLVEFVEKNYSPEGVEWFVSGDMNRPDSYPCVIVDPGETLVEQPFYVYLKDMFDVEMSALNITDSGIVILKVEDIHEQDQQTLQALSAQLKKLGLAALLMDKGDEIIELKHQQLVNIAHSMGYEVKAKGRA